MAQVPSYGTTIRKIMSIREFALGVADVRAGRLPRFDAFAETWDYERGRQWAIAAPPTMPIKVKGKVSFEAIHIFLESKIP
jgi:hypothetical protein